MFSHIRSCFTCKNQSIIKKRERIAFSKINDFALFGKDTNWKTLSIVFWMNKMDEEFKMGILLISKTKYLLNSLNTGSNPLTFPVSTFCSVWPYIHPAPGGVFCCTSGLQVQWSFSLWNVNKQNTTETWKSTWVFLFLLLPSTLCYQHQQDKSRLLPNEVWEVNRPDSQGSSYLS